MGVVEPVGEAEVLSIMMVLRPEDLEALKELRRKMSQTPLIRDLGLEVDLAQVATYALRRGVRGLTAAVEVEVEVMGAEPAVVAAVDVPEEVAEEVPEEVAAVVAEAEGPVPDGWERWSTGERVPDAQHAVHAHYMGLGWERWWGNDGVETMVFYWNPDPTKKTTQRYQGASSAGKQVVVQHCGAHGDAHLIPAGWD